MALEVGICVQISEDCTKAYFFETTGLYNAVTNTGGYGAPNPEVIEFTTATLTLLLAGATVSETPIDIFGGLLFPTATTTLAWQVNASDFGLETFPIGLTRFTYRITGTSGGNALSYMATTLMLSACDYECCVKEKLLAIAKAPKKCSCSDTKIEDWMYAQSMLDGAKLATCCGDTASVDDCLDNLKTICGDCGCSC